MRISKDYLEIALSINKEFNSLNEEFIKFVPKLELLKKKLEASTTRLDKIDLSNTVVKDSDESILINQIMGEMTIYEKEIGKIAPDIERINTRIEELRKQEVDLYNILLETYKDISEEDLFEDVQQYIRNN